VRDGLVVSVDTHKDVHVAVVLDGLGRRLAVRSFPATDAGNVQLAGWLTGLGAVADAGVEGTGSYGYRLARLLADRGLRVWEVNCPDRSRRRRRGKSDPVDAENAARAVLAGEATAVPKDRRGSSTCCCPHGATWPRPGGSSSGRFAQAQSRPRSPPTGPPPIRESSTS
jgi:transposase